MAERQEVKEKGANLFRQISNWFAVKKLILHNIPLKIDSYLETEAEACQGDTCGGHLLCTKEPERRKLTLLNSNGASTQV
jgi:hypothetical protein